MTLEDLIQLIGSHSLALACVLTVPPLAALLLGLAHGPANGGRSPWKYLYSVLIYAACIPGMFASVLMGYALFFRNENILKLNLLVYVLPVVAMAASLLLFRRNISSFDDVPGFGRLSGLMTILAISFAVAFALHRMHFGIVFIAPLAQLGAIALAVFALLHWGVNKFSGKPDPRSASDILKGDDAPAE